VDVGRRATGRLDEDDALKPGRIGGRVADHSGKEPVPERSVR